MSAKIDKKLKFTVSEIRKLESFVAKDIISYSRMVELMNEKIKQAIETTLQTVANEAVVDYNITGGVFGIPESIEVYIVQGSLDEIKQKLLKELL